MAVTVDIYKGSTKLGTGTCTNGSFTVSSYSGTAPKSGRNVQIHSRGPVSSDPGLSWFTRIVTDGGSTLTIKDACPHT